MEADELEINRSTAAFLVHGDGDGWEAAKGDGWVGLGDRIDVGDDAWGVPKTSSKEDGDGKLVVSLL